MRLHGRGHHREEAFLPSTLPTKSGLASRRSRWEGSDGVGGGGGAASLTAHTLVLHSHIRFYEL